MTLIYSMTVMMFLFGLFLGKRGSNRVNYKVTVVVAVRNEEKHIGQLLFDLVHQTYDPALYEVIVVDDGSTDKTADIVKKVAEQHRNVGLLTIRDVPAGLSPKKYALSCAVKKSKSEIILATDADCRFGSRWIETMVSYFGPNTGFVIGFSQLGRKGERQNLLQGLQAVDFLLLMGATAGTCNLGMPLAASGQNMGYRLAAFREIGGYEKVAHRISGDDILLLQLVRRFTRFKSVFASEPAAFAVSRSESRLKEVLNQRKRWASNGSYQVHLHLPFFAYLVLVFLYNILLSAAVFLCPFNMISTGLLLQCALTKVTAEFTLAIKSARIFKRNDLLPYFPLWFIMHCPYVVLVGLLGSLGKYSWKDRIYSAGNKKMAG